MKKGSALYMATKAHYSELAGSQHRFDEALYLFLLPPQELDDDNADFMMMMIRDDADYGCDVDDDDGECVGDDDDGDDAGDDAGDHGNDDDYDDCDDCHSDDDYDEDEHCFEARVAEGGKLRSL